MRGRLLRGVGVLLLTLLPVTLLRIDAVRDQASRFVDFLREGGASAVGVYALAYTVGSLAVAPLWLLSGVAGYAYGFGVGTAVAWPVMTAASTICFLLARRVIGVAEGDDRLARVVREALRQGEGLRLSFLFRLAPVMPQNVLTYVLATTPLQLHEFVLATAAGLLPATVLHTYVGSLVVDAQALIDGKASAPGTLQVVSLVVGVLLIGLTLRAVRGAAQRAIGAIERELRS